ncbi:hypothetical protein [Methylobacterium sp. 092160098-2]|uniref:hypothetical protein n=1 Tax=Methylobacterium sp. 092160098-2 TaxID=3025129 RepID=UPI002381A354|nr:hypothetical protein [Methylobacterium sp. 092160098-2]MDE4915045.1 hypothetical protein [Methylobacterium sp. 092160098-2]
MDGRTTGGAAAPGIPAAAAGEMIARFLASPEMQARRAAREQERSLRRAAAIAEYGSEEVVWRPCRAEAALEAACRPLIVLKPILGDDLVTLMGWDGGRYRLMPPEVRGVVSAACPVPATVREAWREHGHWEKRREDRRAFFEDFDDDAWVKARVALLEHLLDGLPAGSLNDVRARMDWVEHLNGIGFARGNPEDGELLATLRADIERMGALIRGFAAERG